MRGREIEQDHGSLLARLVVELLERALQAHHRLGSPASDELAVAEEGGQAGRVEENEPFGIIAAGGQRILSLPGVPHALRRRARACAHLGMHAMQPRAQQWAWGVARMSCSSVEQRLSCRTVPAKPGTKLQCAYTAAASA